jgi:hypothetical protein
MGDYGNNNEKAVNLQPTTFFNMSLIWPWGCTICYNYALDIYTYIPLFLFLYPPFSFLFHPIIAAGLLYRVALPSRNCSNVWNDCNELNGVPHKGAFLLDISVTVFTTCFIFYLDIIDVSPIK